MGLVCNKSGLQFGISTKPFSYRNTGSKKFGHYCWRSKKCNIARSFEPNSHMFLRYRLHGTQNEWENETCHNSEISKMLSPEKEHFKMDTLSKGLNLIKSKDWTIIIDLSDAYLQVQFSKKYKQYLWFCIRWKTLCFGPTAALRVSTNIVSIIAALLRSQNIRITVFLGDWFLVNQSHRYFLQDR